MKNVLVIEDDENNYVLISDLLEYSGYSPRRAASGEEGVKLATQTNPDVILLDVDLPDIDGYEVLERLRESLAGSPVVIIAMTSYAMSGDRERLLEAGCHGYIEKPIDPSRVIQEIEEIVGVTR